jgi:hypothetical protein
VQSKQKARSPTCFLLILSFRLYFAQARVALVKLLFNFDVKVADTEMESWLDQEAYIACEPKPLRVELIDQQR